MKVMEQPGILFVLVCVETKPEYQEQVEVDVEAQVETSDPTFD